MYCSKSDSDSLYSQRVIVAGFFFFFFNNLVGLNLQSLSPSWFKVLLIVFLLTFILKPGLLGFFSGSALLRDQPVIGQRVCSNTCVSKVPPSADGTGCALGSTSKGYSVFQSALASPFCQESLCLLCTYTDALSGEEVRGTLAFSRSLLCVCIALHSAGDVQRAYRASPWLLHFWLIGQSVCCLPHPERDYSAC